MTRIKITFPYVDWPLGRQLPQKYNFWKNYEFEINPDNPDKEYDYWVIYNFLLESEEHTKCLEGNCILITGEPPSVEGYNTEYIRQFNHVISSNKRLKHKNLKLIPQAHPWFIGKSFDELFEINQVEKTKMISLINSDKIRTRGHIKRREFVNKLKKEFKDKIDVYGKGINFIPDKWDALSPYKFTIAIENASLDYYFTEKIMDPFLALTFPFYYGCTNLKDYFEQGSWIWIDINNFRKSREILEEIMARDGFYEEKISLLKKQKEKILFKYNLFPMIVEFIKNHQQASGSLNYLDYKLYNLNEFSRKKYRICFDRR